MLSQNTLFRPPMHTLYVFKILSGYKRCSFIYKKEKIGVDNTQIIENTIYMQRHKNHLNKLRLVKKCV